MHWACDGSLFPYTGRTPAQCFLCFLMYNYANFNFIICMFFFLFYMFCNNNKNYRLVDTRFKNIFKITYNRMSSRNLITRLRILLCWFQESELSLSIHAIWLWDHQFLASQPNAFQPNAHLRAMISNWWIYYS